MFELYTTGHLYNWVTTRKWTHNFLPQENQVKKTLQFLLVKPVPETACSPAEYTTTVWLSEQDLVTLRLCQAGKDNGMRELRYWQGWHEDQKGLTVKMGAMDGEPF